MNQRSSGHLHLQIGRGAEGRRSGVDALRKQDRAQNIARLREAVLHLGKASTSTPTRETSVRRLLKLIAIAVTVTTALTGFTGCAAAPPKRSDDAATVRKAIEKADQTYIAASV